MLTEALTIQINAAIEPETKTTSPPLPSKVRHVFLVTRLVLNSILEASI